MMTRVRPRYWQARFWLLAQVTIAMVIMASAPGSLSYRAVEAAGSHGWAWIAGLYVLLTWAWADLTINDLMPERYSLPGMRRRYLVYLALSMGLVSICGVVASGVGWTTLILYYGAMAAQAVQIGVTDLMHYHHTRQMEMVR